MRLIMIATACALWVAPAMGQVSPWTHDGVTFPAKAGWCPKTAMQDDGSGGKTSTIEIRPCGQEFPYLSAGVGAAGVARQDLVDLTMKAATTSEGDTGKSIVDGVFRQKSPSCVRQTFSLDRAPLPGTPAFLVNATYSCPALSPDPFQFHNLTAYAQRKNGDLWVVAFDHMTGVYSEEEKAMIRGAIASISAQ